MSSKRHYLLKSRHLRKRGVSLCARFLGTLSVKQRDPASINILMLQGTFCESSDDSSELNIGVIIGAVLGAAIPLLFVCCVCDYLGIKLFTRLSCSCWLVSLCCLDYYSRCLGHEKERPCMDCGLRRARTKTTNWGWWLWRGA